MIKLIVAKDKNNLVGNNGELPWHIKEELQHFRKMTLNSYCLFGRKTFENLPKLDQRKIIVLSTTLSPSENVEQVISNEDELLKLFNKFENSNDVLWICGGKEIFEKYYQYASELWITEIKNAYQGNIYLNMELDLDKYLKNKEFENEQFTIFKYIKK